MSTKHIRTSLFVALGFAGLSCTGADLSSTGTHEEALTVEQCSFFAEGDKVQICHHTGSARKPYTIIRTNVASCGGHADHDGDYVTSADPTSPLYDPTCSGQGCLPEGAPADDSIECCVGLTDVGGVCADIDECATNNGDCGAGRTCADAAVAGQAPTCTDIDECLTDNGGCGAGFTCTNNDGAPPTCTDIDECATDNGGCGSGFTCTNNDGAPPTCTDIDECASDNGGCGTGFTCTNNAGAPPTCEEVNECAAEIYPCGSNSSCVNTVGGFDCSCLGGFENLDGACTDINECAVGNGGCAADQTCTNTAGGRTCTANPDLVRNGSFEDGTFSPIQHGAWVDLYPGSTQLAHWSISNPTGHTAGWHNTSNFSPMKDGGRALDLVTGGRCVTPTAAHSAATQVIATELGATYRLRFHLAAPFDGNGCSGTSTGGPRVIAAKAGATVGTFAVSPSWAHALAWVSHDLTFVATGSSTVISFSVPGVDQGYWGPVLDAVSVVRVAP